MFICPKCGEELMGFHPVKCMCGYEIPRIESVYQFRDEPPIFLEQGGRKYLGCKYTGGNYSPSIVFSENKNDDYGLYGTCSRKLIEILSKGADALDLGAGLGTASIPLAMTGANTIAVNISQHMLTYTARSVTNKKLETNLVVSRMNAYNLLNIRAPYRSIKQRRLTEPLAIVRTEQKLYVGGGYQPVAPFCYYYGKQLCHASRSSTRSGF